MQQYIAWSHAQPTAEDCSKYALLPKLELNQQVQLCRVVSVRKCTGSSVQAHLELRIQEGRP